MNNDTAWKCPSCGGTNEGEIIRCPCGHELSLADSGEEAFSYFRIEPSLTDDPEAFNYKSGKEIRDLLIVTFLAVLGGFIVNSVFDMLFHDTLTEVKFALQCLIFSLAE